MHLYVEAAKDMQVAGLLWCTCSGQLQQAAVNRCTFQLHIPPVTIKTHITNISPFKLRPVDENWGKGVEGRGRGGHQKRFLSPNQHPHLES